MSAALQSLPTLGTADATSHDTDRQIRRRILVVDDDTGVLWSLRQLLATLDVDVETCADPEEVLARLESGACYDCVVSDERMPKMSGLEMLRKIRTASPGTPTILMTGHADSDALDRAYESGGVFGFMQKPWDNFDFLDTVREALRAAAALEN